MPTGPIPRPPPPPPAESPPVVTAERPPVMIDPPAPARDAFSTTDAMRALAAEDIEPAAEPPRPRPSWVAQAEQTLDELQTVTTEGAAALEQLLP